MEKIVPYEVYNNDDGDDVVDYDDESDDIQE